ncbi:MAG: nitroreductase family protein [Clostridia bacterium]|nr:nitroreductase family protein [Clostridia bacterium]
MNVLDAVLSRRTARIFEQDPIPREHTIKMIDLARLSPSAGNMQSLKYLIIDSQKEREAIFPYIRYAGYIKDWNPEFSQSPVAFIAVLNNTEIRETCSFTQCDCGIAMMTVSLAAVEMGYDSCILGAIDRKEISGIIGIPPRYEIMYLIGLGKSNQKNTWFDDNSVKYVMDESYNFKVPKRKLEDVILTLDNRG